jgi:hypothetical protein
MEKNVAFTLISFALLKWDECLSVQVQFELPVQIPVQLLLDLEANWLDQNVNELECSRWNNPRSSTVKLGDKEQICVKELFTDYRPFYTINLLLDK